MGIHTTYIRIAIACIALYAVGFQKIVTATESASNSHLHDKVVGTANILAKSPLPENKLSTPILNNDNVVGANYNIASTNLSNIVTALINGNYEPDYAASTHSTKVFSSDPDGRAIDFLDTELGDYQNDYYQVLVPNSFVSYILEDQTIVIPIPASQRQMALTDITYIRVAYWYHPGWFDDDKYILVNFRLKEVQNPILKADVSALDADSTVVFTCGHGYAPDRTVWPDIKPGNQKRCTFFIHR